MNDPTFKKVGKREKVTLWKRENSIQKYFNSIIVYFYPKKCKLETYKPIIPKYKMIICSLLICFCLITPFTNFMIPTIIKRLIK